MMSRAGMWPGGVALLLLVACDAPDATGANAGGGRAGSGDAAAKANVTDAVAPAPAAAKEAGTGALAPAAAARGSEEEREQRGPSRQARCRINDEPEQACTFTPLFGDGSFDLEMPDHHLRLIVSENEAAPFEVIDTRRVPLVGLLRRDPADRACWTSSDPDSQLKRVCAR